MILTARFGEYTRFRSLHISHTDFPHQRLTFLFLLPTLRIIGEPPEFFVAGIEHVASWSEAEDRLSSSPRQKEEMRAAERSSSNSCTVFVLWQRCGSPLNVWPDLSGNLLLSTVSPPLPVFFVPLSPIFSTLLFLPLCGLGAWGVPFLPAVKAEFPPQHVFSSTQPRKTHHRSQRD